MKDDITKALVLKVFEGEVMQDKPGTIDDVITKFLLESDGPNDTFDPDGYKAFEKAYGPILDEAIKANKANPQPTKLDTISEEGKQILKEFWEEG